MRSLVGRAGLADERRVEHALVAVEPAIRSPGEAVERLVRVLIAPAIEQHLRRARACRRRPSGMKSNCGAAPTQTPPKPTSMPLTRFNPSMKTLCVLESAVAVLVLEDA